MRSFRRKLLAAAGAFFTLSVVALVAKPEGAPPEGAAQKPEKTQGKRSEQTGEKKSDQKKKGTGTSSSPLAAAVLKGYPSKGVKIPRHEVDAEGSLQMNFEIGVATRLDDEQVRMDTAQLETFEEGEREMLITLPTAVFNLSSWVIRADQPVTIQRPDLEVTGRTMVFNTKTRQGKLGGGVRMLIFDLDSSEEEQPASP
jgi:hypothetical protein